MIDDHLLLAVLADSQRFGALGESPQVALAHAERFLAALGAASVVLDLGSGGGVPGLVLAVRRPDLSLVLLDRRTARTDLLRRLVLKLGVSERVRVVSGDALLVGRQPEFVGAFDTVVCRSFGSPEVTAACASPFLGDGGHLVVTEPPGTPPRWGCESIQKYGLSPVESPPGLQILQKLPKLRPDR